jgi:hypothetical protein
MKQMAGQPLKKHTFAGLKMKDPMDREAHCAMGTIR